MLKNIVFIFILGFSLQVSARMYQWVDPVSGTTQLSGKPPAWYRSTENGPRVFVFEKGKAVDDTGIEVAEEERDKLRQEALLQAEADKEAAREKQMEAKRLQAALEQQGRRDAEDEAIIEELPEEEELDVAKDREEAQGPTAEDMRGLIEQWEKLQTESAKKLLGTE